MSVLRYDLMHHMNKLFDEAEITLSQKSGDYADAGDVLSAFRYAAEEVAVTKQQVWAIFFMKHVRAILAYAREGKVESEPLRQRIIDAINYLVLLSLMEETDGKD